MINCCPALIKMQAWLMLCIFFQLVQFNKLFCIKNICHSFPHTWCFLQVSRIFFFCQCERLSCTFCWFKCNINNIDEDITRVSVWLGAGVSSARMRGDGQSPLYLRAPMKALGPVGSMTGVRQHAKGPPGAQAGMRRVQSPGPSNGASYSGSRSAAVTRQTPGRGMTPTSPSSRGRLPQTPRR